VAFILKGNFLWSQNGEPREEGVKNVVIIRKI
jgi:hypothetical protein